jgi:hypothetical protein
VKVDGAHLTYCTNIHPGETWNEIRANLGRYLPLVRQRVSPRTPFGVGLRLSAVAARTLSGRGCWTSSRACVSRAVTSSPSTFLTVRSGTRVKEDVTCRTGRSGAAQY